MRQKIETVIKQFIQNEFQGPFSGDFFSEEDVRAVLFTRLKDEFKYIRRVFPVENLPDDAYKKDLQTDLVKSEYSYEDYQGKICMAFDIAVLHEDQRVWVDSEKWKRSHFPRPRKTQMFWNQPVRFGIEVKAESHFSEFSKALEKLKRDQQKMRNYLKSSYSQTNFRDGNNDLFPFEGCALVFLQYEKVGDNFEPTDQIKLSQDSNAYCITPSKIYKVNF